MKIFIINLDRRPDRFQQTVIELARFGLSGERIQAVDGLNLTINEEGRIPGYKKRQHLESELHYRGTAGCLFSHMKALEAALSCNHWPCLILEDDILISGTEPITLPTTTKEIIYLGGNPQGSKGVYSSHAILYKSAEIARQVLDYHSQHPNAVDYNMIRFNRLHDCCYYDEPYRFWQRNDISDIFGVVRGFLPPNL